MKKKFSLFMLLVIILVSAIVTMAPSNPPPSDWDCSPGYWKNHPETWGYAEGFTFYDGSDNLGLMDALTQKGWGNKDAKWAAVDFLNDNALGDVNCGD